MTAIVEGVLKYRERRGLLWGVWRRTDFHEEVRFDCSDDRYFLPGNFILSMTPYGREVRTTIRYEGRLVMGTSLDKKKTGIPFTISPRRDMILEGSVRLI